MATLQADDSSECKCLPNLKSLVGLGVLMLGFVYPWAATAGHPKSDIYFLFVKDTGKIDRETGEAIFDVQRKVKIEEILFDEPFGRIRHYSWGNFPHG